MTKQYAEDMSYWDTDTHPATSQGEVEGLLLKFGAKQVQIMTGSSSAGDYTWIVRFEYGGKVYHKIFSPFPCRYPHKSRSAGRGKGQRTYPEQAKWQMGRRAVYLIKAILNLAAEDPTILAGLLEVPGTRGAGGLPVTLGEIDLPQLTSKLPLLTATVEDGQFTVEAED